MTARGLFTTPISTAPAKRVSHDSTSATGAASEARAPGLLNATARQTRRTRIVAPSDGESTPATQAAATSPWELPMTAAGVTP